MMPVVVIQFFGGSSRLVILLYGKICDGRKRGVQAEIVLHLFEYTSDGKVERSCLYRVQRESVGASSNTSSSSHFGLFRT